MEENGKTISPLSILPSLLIFGTAGLILYLETNFLIPYLASVSGTEAVIWWFIVAAFGIFIPLLVVAACMLYKEGYLLKPGMWEIRLRFRTMNTGDWMWGIGGIIVIGILSYPVMIIIETIVGYIDHQPPFMQFEPLGLGRYWILLVWLPYWIFNIMGEEILWRGVVLPRQEISFGKYAWLIHGFGWGLFHIAFGWQLLITLIPTLFVQSYIVQKRKNSWIGVLIHAGINGPSFIAISLGYI
ncbi:MAG: CPBP family intramembrane metalloprotease [Bacteroidales bacterium]|nr:CPBP family intramembrane metalloprotease [Bacteroidales bacterium]